MVMRQSLHLISEVLRDDPGLALGLALVASAVALFIYIELRMRDIGYKPSPFTKPIKYHNLPFEYLRVRARRGWSPWPAYLIWPCLIVGLLLLVFGVAHLPD